MTFFSKRNKKEYQKWHGQPTDDVSNLVLEVAELWFDSGEESYTVKEMKKIENALNIEVGIFESESKSEYQGETFESKKYGTITDEWIYYLEDGGFLGVDFVKLFSDPEGRALAEKILKESEKE